VPSFVEWLQRTSPVEQSSEALPNGHTEWPVYAATPLSDRSSLDGLASDIRIVSEAWFKHTRHESAEDIVWALPLASVRFGVHDR
jgi:hypothetical protein